MITGIGVDIVSIGRIREAMRNPRFLRRILTLAERHVPLEVDQIAARWAAKEAIAKAVHAGLRWHDVEILSDDEGKPVVRISGLPEGSKVFLSLSHERDNAVAMAVVEAT